MTAPGTPPAGTPPRVTPPPVAPAPVDPPPVAPAPGQPVLVLNGPNLGRLGTREPEVYGTTTYAQLVELCQAAAAEVGLHADVRQTDDEATMLGWLHTAADARTPVVINPGAWSHYSYALRDACAALTAPLVEVHISQVHAREMFRHVSVVSPVATGTITGLGVDGYRAALRHLALAVPSAQRGRPPQPH